MLQRSQARHEGLRLRAAQAWSKLAKVRCVVVAFGAARAAANLAHHTCTCGIGIPGSSARTLAYWQFGIPLSCSIISEHPLSKAGCAPTALPDRLRAHHGSARISAAPAEARRATGPNPRCSRADFQPPRLRPGHDARDRDRGRRLGGHASTTTSTANVPSCLR